MEMQKIVSITSQGQLTIPQSMLKSLGITGPVKAIIRKKENTLLVVQKKDLWYLVGDDKLQQQKAQTIFQKAKDGKISLVIKPLIVAEACFVLESFYQRGREEIADAFEVFLSQKWLKVEERETLLALWDWYKKNFHFVDSYLLSWAKLNAGKIVTFDKKLLSSSS